MALKPDVQPQARLLVEGILLFAGASAEHVQALLAEFEQLDVKKGKVVLRL